MHFPPSSEGSYGVGRGEGFKLTSPGTSAGRTLSIQQQATPEHVDKMTQHHGWFKDQLMLIEAALWGRWPYWVATVLNRSLGPLPDWAIPQIPFAAISGNRTLNHPSEDIRRMVGTADEAKKQVFDAFGRALRTGGYLGDLLRWWLFAFGSPTAREQPRLSDEAKVAMYSGLNIGWFLGHPGDWGAELCLEFLGPDRRGGWFPTPITIVQMMTDMMFVEEGLDTRSQSVHDPCVGTGVMLLCASNYSLSLSGQDISQTMCLACEFNAWLFVPWLVYGVGSVRELRPKEVGRDRGGCEPKSEQSGNLKAEYSEVNVMLREDEVQGNLFGGN